ncbi:MAG TPA: hypothetical protein VIX14_01470 [Terriglobales bacterium]
MPQPGRAAVAAHPPRNNARPQLAFLRRGLALATGFASAGSFAFLPGSGSSISRWPATRFFPFFVAD